MVATDNKNLTNTIITLLNRAKRKKVKHNITTQQWNSGITASTR